MRLNPVVHPAIILLVVFSVAARAAEPSYLPLVEKCLDTLIEKGTDRYGPVQSPILVSIVDVEALACPCEPLQLDEVWRVTRRERRNPAGANLLSDMPLLHAAISCSRVTQRKKYAQAAHDYANWCLENLVDERGRCGGDGIDRYAWDEETGKYFGATRLDGTIIEGPRVLEGQSKDEPRGHLDIWEPYLAGYQHALNTAQAYADAFRLTKDRELLEAVERFGDWIASTPTAGAETAPCWYDQYNQRFGVEGTYAGKYGRAILFLLDAHRLTGRPKHLLSARRLADEAVRKLRTEGGLFRGHPAKPYYESMDGVGYLLLALYRDLDPQRFMIRYHSLDALRAFALLLGVVFHAAESFMADHYEWAIVDCAPSTTLAIFRFACHCFRLEIFFLIAGFFACLLYERRGWREFTRNRFQRIVVPLVVGWLILYPLLVSIWLWGASKSGHWERVGIAVDYQHLPPWQLAIGFFAARGYIDKFDLTHLWFLHQLLVIYVTFLAARAILVRWPTVAGACRRTIGTVFRRALESRWQIVLLAAPAIPLLLTMDSWGVDTPKDSLIPHLPTTLFYGYCFVLGWLLYRQTDLLNNLAQRWQINMALGIALVLPSWAYLHTIFAHGLRPGLLFWARIGHVTLYALMMWGLVLGVTGLFLKYCQAHRPAWRYIADSSYWIYIAHIPVIVSLQILIAYVDLPWPPKFLTINLVAFSLLLLSYHYLVRSTPIGAQLNGRKYPFVPLGAAWADSRCQHQPQRRD